jgi:anti-sigma factor RsiW
MNNDFKLKLQSLVDGELSGREASDLEARLAADPEAKALKTEMEMTRQALRGNEMDRPAPLSREFYWSQIERRIEAGERAAARPASGLGEWLARYWPQLSGAAVAACLLMLVALNLKGLSESPWEDIETPLAEAGSFSFRSEQQRLTLVWVSYGNTSGGETLEGAVN